MTLLNKPNTFTQGTAANASEVNDNFDTLYNDYNGSISASNLASNSVTTSKIADSNVTTAKIADSGVTTAKINDAAVTAAKRSGGFFIGTISGSTLGSTGNKAITGVGFTPKMVRFSILPSASTSGTSIGFGAMTTSSQYYTCTANGSNNNRASGTDGCIAWLTFSSSTSTPSLKCSYVSMDSDGFTINVGTAASSFDLAFEAYG